MKMLPVQCPACKSKVKVKSLICESCGTQIEGKYELPVLAGLSGRDQQFLLEFIKASGSLKQIAKIMGLSYPTVRNRLDEIIERIKAAEDESQSKQEQEK